MQFHPYLWENYRETKAGKRTIDFFSRFGALLDDDPSSEIADYVNSQYYEPYETERVNSWCDWANSVVSSWAEERSVDNLEEAEKLYTELVLGDGIEIELEDGSIDVFPVPPDGILTSDDLHIVSFGLYKAHPEYFIPYVFMCHFFRLSQIFDTFDIVLPKIPVKRDINSRRFYYWNLCRALYEFRQVHGLSPEELCAFLYDFGPNFQEGFLRADLPEATRAFMVGAHRGNWSFIDDVDSDSISHWQGSPETVPGDIVLMYCLAPRSHIHSVWRAISTGFIDPFFHYYNSIWIGRPTRVEGPDWATFKTDPVLSEWSAVKQNLQGINGRALSESQYNQFLSLMNQEGLPRLMEMEQFTIHTIQNEREVELYLLEPLLERLGYSSNNWVRQMPLRFGRGERIYPDYVIGAKAKKKGEETGEFIWEAKYRISNRQQLRAAFMQANSYARHLNARGLGLVALEGVWVATETSGMTFERLEHYTWAELATNDGLRKLIAHVPSKFATKPKR
ncbi:MAG: hypothetical protein GY847_05540 [Proteobacteria bacterium]|nr:hypothetical protein [Pseudomonadota bacterium]